MRSEIERLRRSLAAVTVAAFFGWASPLAAADPPASPGGEEGSESAHDHGPHHPEGGLPAGADRTAEIERAREYFTDVVLVDQDGERKRLYSDLLHGKTVVINPFFTTCTGVCPVLTAKVAAIQQRFADRLGKDLYLISISVDPETDTPARLKAYAERFNAKPGWTFVAGEKENVDWALYRLGQYVEDKEAHTNVFVIGNEATGHWRKAFGLSSAEELIRMVEEVLDDAG